LSDIAGCRRFLARLDEQAAARAAAVIDAEIQSLATTPEIGRPFPPDPSLRELVIPFGSSGYLVLYRYDRTKTDVLVLAVRHQREAGY
jgi:plasmid stabilization system protein ParE